MKARGWAVVVLVLAALLVAGVARLFQLGFEEGDVFPPYSSMRSDPLGTRALYEALSTLDGLSVERHMDMPTEIEGGRDTTLLILGAYRTPDPEEHLEALEKFAEEGGRIVIGFLPVTPTFARWQEEFEMLEEEFQDDKKKDGDTVSGADGDTVMTADGDTGAQGPVPDDECINCPPAPPWAGEYISIAERWGFEYGYYTGEDTEYEGAYITSAEREGGPDGLPENLEWHSAMYFGALSEPWSVLYSTDPGPVMVERPYGKGSIILTSDAFFMSNEAMRGKRHPKLLAWVIGKSDRIIFDEAHLGLIKKPGLMVLIRRYDLTWTLLALFVVAGLFVWKNMVGITPKRDPDAAPQWVMTEGKGSGQALVNLLRRSVPRSRILTVCETEWRKAVKAAGGTPDWKIRKVSEVAAAYTAAPAGRRNAASAYNRIARLIAERKTKSE